MFMMLCVILGAGILLSYSVLCTFYFGIHCIFDIEEYTCGCVMKDDKRCMERVSNIKKKKKNC